MSTEKTNENLKSTQRESTLQDALNQGLNGEEYDRIIEIMGRIPNETELAIFSVMWSEHCSYKNSILELKTLPRSGGKLLVAAGEENAGLVDIGDGLAVAFKIESHNHPSAVEPFQGAATGVGGILRDIFTMGARPLAILNSLRFGDLTSARNRFLLDGVVRGIAHYGNCFGVPTAAGEVYFDASYTGNPLVNAMAVGIVHHDQVAKAKASGVGNSVIYVGSKTGRDGIHGATFASEELNEDNESKRPAVQVGDPFAEKLLLEATLEITKMDALVSIQDMGAAGLTCSSSEMAAGGGVGMELDLDLVPLRETEMTSWEIMLSESQERMLLVAKVGMEEQILDVFRKWDLEAHVIGKVTDDGLIRLYHHGEVVAEVPAHPLVLGGGAPQYKREYSFPKSLEARQNFDVTTLPEPDNYGEVLVRLLTDPTVASKKWIYEQYDHSVRSNTVLEPGRGDAAVIRVEGTNKGLSVCTDCNSHWVGLNPRKGTAHAVVEAARNVACTGAVPLAITNCLNFGNPYKKEVYYYFHEAIVGMGEACRELNTPVTGGNVSFYNETDSSAVLPTPVIGMLGMLDNVEDFVPMGFQRDDDVILLLGKIVEKEFGGTTYQRVVHGVSAGEIPAVNYEAEKKLITLLVELAHDRLISSAHDVSDGGLAVAIAESCLSGRGGHIGANIDFKEMGRLSHLLFGEHAGLVVVSCAVDNVQRVQDFAMSNGVPVEFVGRTGGDRFIWNSVFDLPLSTLSEAYYDALQRKMEG